MSEKRPIGFSFYFSIEPNNAYVSKKVELQAAGRFD